MSGSHARRHRLSGGQISMLLGGLLGLIIGIVTTAAAQATPPMIGAGPGLGVRPDPTIVIGLILLLLGVALLIGFFISLARMAGSTPSDDTPSEDSSDEPPNDTTDGLPPSYR